LECWARGAEWVSGVFTNRAILSYNGPYNGLGSNDKWSKERLGYLLEEGAIRGHQSLKILQQRLEEREWLVLGRPTIADISVFVYVALAPMGDISLKPYPAVETWIERVKGLPRFISIPGLDNPLIRRR
jgi:glutathione S-transferase